MSDYLSKVVYLTDAQYTTLISNTNTTIGGHKYDPNALYITNSKGDADTVNGHTVEHDVPFDAVFTDTNKYHTSGSWNNMTYTAESVNGAGELSITLPVISAEKGGTGKTSLNDSANALINALTVGTDPLSANDYVITQYIGGGSTTTTYHRRKASNVINATLVKAALSATATSSNHSNQFLRKDGSWQSPPYPVTSVNNQTGDVTIPTATTNVAGITTVGASGGAAAYSHTHDYLANTNKGSKLKPIYITGNAAAECEQILPVYFSEINFNSTTPAFGAYPLNGSNNPVTNVSEYGSILSLPGASNASYYGAQMIISSPSGQASSVHAYIRRLTSSPSWSDWSTLLDDKNTTIPSTVPTLSWGATATILTINGSAVKIKAMDKPTYTASDVGAATAAHTHDITLTAAGTATVTLSADTTYTLSAGGESVVFKTPADNNTDKNVEQGVDATTYYRGVLLTTTTYSTTSPSVSTTTGIVYSTTGIVVKPSDNSLYVSGNIYTGGDAVATIADIQALDVSNITGFGTTKTLKTLTETDGKIAATFQDIAFPVTKVAGKTGDVTLGKGDVGLGNVDNTADANKNVNSATEFSSAASVTLTGDVTGNASSTKGWSIATTIANKAVTPAKMADTATITIGTQAIKVGGSFNTSTLVTDLGLSSAMHFLGLTTTNIAYNYTNSTESTTNPITISGSSVTAVNGDVVLYDHEEYVWNGSKWLLLGDETEYKRKQTAITSTTGTAETTAVANFLYSISQNANGEISVTNRPLPVATTSVTGIVKLGTNATDAAAGDHNHDDTYVNISGDTMTGELKFINPESTWPATYKMVTLKAKDNREFNFKISNSGTNVDVGYDWNAVDGPGAAFRSSSHTSEAGYFYIYARSRAGTTQLKGTPAGVLTWGDQNVMASAGASNSTSALYLIGATTQTTGPLTYSNSYLFAQNGALSARSVGINYGTTANKAVVQWNDTDKSLDFIFN